MSMTTRSITVAQEAQEFIAAGSAAITSATPDRILVYLARKYVETLERQQARESSRRIEREVAQVIRRTPEQVEADIARTARRKAWEAVLGQKFAVGDGREATWGAATREQHHARATAQRNLARAVSDDAAMHEAALADMARFGVNSLDEL